MGKFFCPSGRLADVLKGQTPPPPLSAIVRNFQTPTPPPPADVLIECPLEYHFTFLKIEYLKHFSNFGSLCNLSKGDFGYFYNILFAKNSNN